MTRILIAEDEERLAAFLEKGLQANGYVTTVARDGIMALTLARETQFDLLILDLGLPALDGMGVLDQLRRQGEQVPVVVLSARDETEDKVTALERGADDYVSKPFRFEELLARVRVRLRPDATPEQSIVREGRLVLDLRSRRAAIDGRAIELSAREFVLLEVFLRHAGQVLTRQQLLSHVWGYDFEPGSNVVDVYVGYLRRKLGKDSIETVRGMGYRLADVD